MLASREKISTRQAFMFFILFVLTSTIRLLPTNVADTGERAGWLTPLFSILPFVCLVYINQSLYINDKDANLSDVIIKVAGRIIGAALLFLYLLWMMISLAIYVRYFAEKILSSMLPNTSLNFFTVTILAVVFYTLRGEIVYICRTIEFLFLLFTIVFAALFILTVPKLEVINLLPVTYYDILPLIKSSYSNIALWSTFTFIFFFGDKINDKEHIKRFGLQTTVYLAIITLMVLIQTIGVYGYSVIGRISMPYFFVVKSISILKTIERIESIAIASWVVIDFAAICFYSYITLSIIKSLFSLSDHKPFTSPIIIFAFIFTQYIASNRFELERFSNFIGVPANIIFGFIFPLLIMIIGKVRKKI